MGRKHVVHAVIASEIDATATQIIKPTGINCRQLDYAGVKFSWSDPALVGELKVQATNKKVQEGQTIDASDWYDLTFALGSTITIDATETTQTHNIIFVEMPFEAIRLDYTYTSGAGTISSEIVMKSKGA